MVILFRVQNYTFCVNWQKMKVSFWSIRTNCLPLQHIMSEKTIIPATMTDVTVLLIFFTRTETLRRTFDVIRQARPARLYLYQDGPRNAEEAEKLAAAREIVSDENIDWPAEVHRSYHTENGGAWASNYRAQRWVFGEQDRCIVLEDDSTPSASFIPFCKELLDRYADDQRVGLIAGFNHEEVTDSPYDYLFTTVMPIWGWATWRRVVDQWDEHYSVIDDNYNMHQLEALVDSRHYGWKEMVRKMRSHQQAGQPIYETQLWQALMFSSGLTIVPTRNMISNSGVSSESAHFTSSLKTLPKAMQRLMTMPSHDVSFPLRHPKYVIENVEYKERVFRIMAWEHPLVKTSRSMEELWRNLRYGSFRNIWASLLHRIRKLTGQHDYL